MVFPSPPLYALRSQALLVADDPTFTNCLVVMRPKTTKEELPSRAIVRKNIKNKFIQFIKGIRSDIAVAPGNISINHDLWTEDHSSTAFFGITAQWIDVKDLRPWTLRAEVVGFHKVLGDHSGSNLGRQLLKVTDCAGITSKKDGVSNKVRGLLMPTMSFTEDFLDACSSVTSRQTMRRTMALRRGKWRRF